MEQEKDDSFVESFKLLLKENFEKEQEITYSSNDGLQKLEVRDVNEDSAWLIVQMEEIEEENDNFENIAQIGMMYVIDIIEKKIATKVDELALLN